MRAHIDSKICTGHGMCYLTAPDVFADDEGYGQVLGDGLVTPDTSRRRRPERPAAPSEPSR